MNKDNLALLLNIVSDDDEYNDDFDESSESSESEEVYERQKRHSIPFYFEKVVPTYTEKEFITHFRVSRHLFHRLAKLYSECQDYKSLDQTKVISAEKSMAIFIWFAAHEACAFRDISDRFDVSISTVHVVIMRVSYFVSSLSDQVIKWPTTEKKTQSSQTFAEKHGFPGIIGCIDGTHIVIDPPRRSKDDYMNRKHDFSICVQGICNEQRKFLDIFIGFPGSAHDSRVLKNSPIYPRLNSLCGDGEFHLLGDSAYPCTQYLLTPYRDNGHLSAREIYFNKCLSSSRIKIEHSFGILKQRFRQLYYCKLVGIENLSHFIRACCVLHNLCSESELVLLNIDINRLVIEEDIPENSGEIQDNAAGKAKRNEISHILFT